MIGKIGKKIENEIFISNSIRHRNTEPVVIMMNPDLFKRLKREILSTVHPFDNGDVPPKFMGLRIIRSEDMSIDEILVK